MAPISGFGNIADRHRNPNINHPVGQLLTRSAESEAADIKLFQVSKHGKRVKLISCDGN